MISERVRRIMVVLAAATVVQVAAADELVQIIEEKLDALGYDTGAVDGEATVKTAVAISQFQAESGMPVTGEPSPQLAGMLAAKAGATGAAESPAETPTGAASAAVDACLDRKREEKKELKAAKEKRFGEDSKMAKNSSLELTDKDVADCSNAATAAGAVAGGEIPAGATVAASTAGSPGGVVPVLDGNQLYWKAIRDGSWQSGAITEAGYTLCVGGRDPQFRANALTLLSVRFEHTPSVIAYYLDQYDETYERELERRKTGGCAMGTNIEQSVTQSYTRNLDWIIDQSAKAREVDEYRAAQQQPARPAPDLISDANGDDLDCNNIVTPEQRIICQKAGKTYRQTAVRAALRTTAMLEAYGKLCGDPSGAAARAKFESIAAGFATANRKALVEQYERDLQSVEPMAQQVVMSGPQGCPAGLPRQYRAYADMLAACREC